MKDRILVVGLGNPGDKFTNTRHNAGYMFLDYLVRGHYSNIKHDSNWKYSKKLEGDFIKLTLDENLELILLKPTTYMNNSGRSVSKASKWFEINIEKNLFVAYDDLDLVLGKIKIRRSGPRVHNGVSDIIKSLNTKKFIHIRIGTDNRDTKQRNNQSGCDYVLGKFTKIELEKLQNSFPEIVNHDQWRSVLAKHKRTKDDGSESQNKLLITANAKADQSNTNSNLGTRKS